MNALLVVMLAAALFSGRIPPGESAGREDLDGDGRMDCWRAVDSGGSGAGGVVLDVEAPCGSAAIEVDTTSSFGSFLARSEVPDALATGVAGLLYGPEHVRGESGIDESFRLLLGERSRWVRGKPREPDNQVLVRRGEMIAYFAHNHGAIARVARCRAFDLYATRHGVAAYDRARGRWRWIWIANDVDKLRIASIRRVQCGRADSAWIETADDAFRVPIRKASSR